MVKVLVSSLVLLALAALALRFVVAFVEPRMTFFPVRDPGRVPPQGTGVRELNLQTRDRETLYAWWMSRPEPLAQVVFFHGNAGNLFLWEEFLNTLYARNLSVLAVDYRGYGKSSGSPTEGGLYLDADALLDRFWETLHRPGPPVVYWGRSLGGVVAAYASSRRRPHGLILEATFPSKQSLLSHYPILKFLSLFSRYRLPTAEMLRTVTCPVLILHGDADTVVPLHQGRLLLEQLPMARKSLCVIPGAHHNDIQLIDPDLYWSQILQFVGTLDHGQDSS